MIKRFIQLLTFLFITTAFIAAPASALMIGGHGAIGTGDDNNNRAGWGFQVRANLPATGTIEAAGTWNTQEFDVGSVFGDAEVDSRLYGLSALFHIPFSPVFEPYLGVGVNRFEVSGNDGFSFRNRTGYHFLGGLRFDFTQSLSFFADYQLVFQKLRGEDPLGMVIDQSIRFGLVRVGLGFNF